MASVNGLSAGYVPETPPEPPKKKRKRKKALGGHTCEACGEDYTAKVSVFYTPDEHGTYCLGCMAFFGMGQWGAGCTNVDPKTTIKKLAEIKEAQWAIMLASRRFGGAVYNTIELGFGDVFKVTRVGGKSGGPKCTLKEAHSRFSIDVAVGEERVTLYPHEVAAMPFLDILQLKNGGLYEESFVTPEDQGYFNPTKKGKAEIIDTFGDR